LDKYKLDSQQLFRRIDFYITIKFLNNWLSTSV